MIEYHHKGASVLVHETRQYSKLEAILYRIAGIISRLLLATTQDQFPTMNSLLPYPFFILSSIIAFNITAFAVVLQLDMLIIDATVYKIISWLVSAGAWTIVYFLRNR